MGGHQARELQVVTLGFKLDPVYIPAKRSDVFRTLLYEPEIYVKIHPLCTGVSNIVRSQDKDGRRIVDFDIQERLVLLGFYETSNSTFHVTTKALEENVATQLTAKPLRGMVKINQGFDFSDAKKGNEDGTMLGDHAEYTAPRILARFVLREAVAAHTAITQNIRQHFMEVSQQAMDDI
ncbi:hypothetical protein OS493_010672 [Desmophyllum pertusum]|uniref:Uncharacterized protein n=1 Tax=Desmophyllum pertusum TaxID=174260 RepID=A0A9W9ZQV2_9CNID|nr:hypothetical protein OS493_010672 [Desmophyllum pertusum]